MRTSTTLTRVAVAAALGGAALAATPTLASAASTCTYDAAAKRVTITQNASSLTLLPVGLDIKFRDGTGFAQGCFSSSGQPAQLFNTNSISVVAAVPSAQQELVIDQTNGKLEPGATPEPAGHRSAIEVAMNTGGGNDHVVVKGTSASDSWRFKDLVNLGGAAVGARLDLDGDTDTDVSAIKATLVRAFGGRGDDFINAGGVTSYSVELHGGLDDDSLIGGNGFDLLAGEENDDFIFSRDGLADAVQGGSGTNDSAIIDFADQAGMSGVEKPSF